MNQHHPNIIALQEVKLSRNNHNFKLKGYDTFVNARTAHGGGVALFVLEGSVVRPVNLQTSLEAIAININFPYHATVCSLYIPPNTEVSKPELETLFEQLPRPAIILGDVNAKNGLWSDQEDSRGRMIASVLEEQNLVVLNDGSLTLFPHQTEYNPSTPDISVCSPDLADKLDWKVGDDLHGSDHAPIFVGKFSLCAKQKRRPCWKIFKADWSKYEEEIEKNIKYDCSYSIEQITECIISAAMKSIPKSSDEIPNRAVPWWCDRVEEAVKKRKKYLRLCKRKGIDKDSPDFAVIHSEFRKARNEARKVIAEEKRKSWEQYVSSINESTPVKEMWSKVRAISGKRSNNINQGIQVDNVTITDPKHISEYLACHFEKASSDEAFDDEFRRRKIRADMKPVHLSDEESQYTKEFTIHELLYQIDRLTGTSPGPDEVHNTMLQRLPFYAKRKLLNAYNNLWAANDFPSTWKETLLIPIPKPGKSLNDPHNLRPIHLSSCVLKLFERMVNRRLLEALEEQNAFGQQQAGFRRGRQTLDTLTKIEQFGRNAVAEKQHAELLLLDIEKAYDRTWRRLILEGLQEANIGGRLAKFCRKFLDERVFRVCYKGFTSSARILQNGVPQGSVLAVTFFLLAVNSIRKYVKDAALLEMFADDITIGVSSSNVLHTRHKLQKVLKQIELWCKRTGFKMSVSKTVAMHICTKRFHKRQQPPLKYGDKTVEFVTAHKVLGVWLDSRLSFKQHVAIVRTEGRKVLNLFKCLGNRDFGADRSLMLRILQVVLLPKLLYGSPITSAADLKPIFPIYHEAIRCCTGAFRSSPIESVLAESGMLPLDYYAKEQMILYAVRQRERQRIDDDSPVYLRAMEAADWLGLEIPSVTPAGIPFKGDWMRHPGHVRIPQLDQGPSIVKKCKFEEIVRKEYNEQFHVYTDGSLSETGVGCGIHGPHQDMSIRLPKELSIFSAEAWAILTALEKYSEERSTMIFSDSQSVLTAVLGTSLNHPWITQIRRLIAESNGNLKLCWVPAHSGIAGNERADELAKNATNRPMLEASPSIPYPDFKRMVRYYLWNMRSTIWHNSTTKLRRIKSSPFEWKTSRSLQRRDSRVLTRLRIGHTALTHGHLMANVEPEQCDNCGVPVTIEHIIVDCRKYVQARRDSGIAESLYIALGDNVDEVKKCIEFFKNINMYYQI